MKKIISTLTTSLFVSGAVLLCGTSCFAEITDLGYLRANINEMTNCPEETMNIEVYAPGKSYKDLSSASDYTDVMVFGKQVQTDSSGNISINFEVGGNDPVSGIYTAEIAGENFYKKTEGLIVNTEKAMTVISDINASIGSSSDAIEKISGYLKANCYDLYVEKEEYVTDKTADKAANLVYQYLTLENITLSEDNAPFIMNKAVCIAALENNLVDNVIDDALLFGMDKGELSDWYKKYYVTETTGKKVAQRLSGKTYSSFKDFDEKLTESFILSVIEKPDGVDNAREIMQAFSDKIGTGSKGTESRYSYICDKYYKNYAELRTAFDSYADKNGGTSGSGSGNGGSGNSGSGKIPSTEISTDNGTVSNPNKYYPLTIFTDLDSVPWAEEAIVALAENGIIKGKGNDLFCPDDNITREEFAAMVVNAFIPNQTEADISFEDTAEDGWYFQSIRKAYGAGIVKGIDESHFGVGSNITRQDMSVMLFRAGMYVGGVDYDTQSEVFDDDNNISDYASEAVYKLKSAGIINGIDEYNFAPLDNATRAQAAKMIYGMLKLQGGI